MIVIDNLNQVLAQIESERGISKEIIMSAIEQALVSACRRKFPEEADLRADLDPLSGHASIYRVFTVVDDVENDDAQLTLKEAKKQQSDIEVGGELIEDVTPDDFGRIAAQTAKQVIIQRIREAEKTMIFEEFTGKVGSIVTGTIQRVENQHYLVNLGRTEAMLFSRDQIPGETFHAKEKVRVYISDIEKNNRGAFIQISRTHPGFLKQLFEQEIPEIQDGIIDVMSVSREPGKRAKVAVRSNNPSIGAVGTCVGHMGSRIQSVIKELGTEKIDVLEWHENPSAFISNALKPAKITEVLVGNDEEKTATVIVPNDQLSLAIGKGGVNVRLSVKLTGWKLDIMSESEYNNKDDDGIDKSKLSLMERLSLEKEKEQASQDDTSSDEDSGDGKLVTTLNLKDDENPVD